MPSDRSISNNLGSGEVWAVFSKKSCLVLSMHKNTKGLRDYITSGGGGEGGGTPQEEV